MKINLNSEIDLTLIVNSKREIGLVHFHFGGVLFKLGLYFFIAIFDWGFISFSKGWGCIQEWGCIQADTVVF